MSSRWEARLARRIGIGATLACALATSARAQSTAEARADLDRLLPEWRAAREAAAEGELARRRRAGAVLIERGSLRITADSVIAGPIADAATKAWASIERDFGAEAALLVRYPMIAVPQRVMQNGDTSRVIRMRLTEPDIQPGTGAGRVGTQERAVVVRDGDLIADELGRAIEAIAAHPLHATLDDNLRLWFRSALPATPETDEALETMYIGLATASTGISRRCLSGEVLGCRQVLGLSPVTDAVMEGHTATQRRSIVKGNVEALRTPARTAEFDRCVRDGDDAACVARLRDFPVDRLASSYSPTMLRRGFAQCAIAQGGPGAYSRLRASVGRPLAERFALAAGMPIDAAIAGWHRHLLRGRPAAPGIPPLTAFTALFWIGACGALSLRSSRWR